MNHTELDDLIKELQRRSIDEAQQQADEIVAQATQKAEEIIEKAKQQAAQIVTKADQHRDSTRASLEVELRQAIDVGLAAFRQVIEKGFVVPHIDEVVREAVSRPGFMQEAIAELVRAFARDGMSTDDIEVLLPEGQKEQFGSAFIAQLAAKGAGGVKLRFDDSLSFGFRIGPRASADGKGGFSFDLSEEGFRQVLVRFVSPRFRAFFYPAASKGDTSNARGSTEVAGSKG